jgi:hypothetical protein
LVTTKDTAEHQPGGFHSASATPVNTCTYSHNVAGLANCDTACAVVDPATVAVPSGIATDEEGALFPEVRGIHHVGGSWSDGAAVAGGGGVSCTGTFGGAAVNCGILDGVSCTLNVTLNGGVVQVSPVAGESKIWASAPISIPATCPAVSDPQNHKTTFVGGGPTDPCLNSVTADPLFGSTGSGNAPDCSPIIIDVTGEGIKLTQARFGVHFDMKGTGIKSIVAWTWPGEGAQGFLALDRNGNGTVDDGTELFGNFTPQPASDSPNGFAALAEYDKPENGGNGDGVISALDKIWGKLMIWVDYNHDGISQPEELKPLSFYHIEAVDLVYKEDKHIDSAGNAFRYKAQIVSDNSGKGNVGRWAWDVFLTVIPDPAQAIPQ